MRQQPLPLFHCSSMPIATCRSARATRLSTCMVAGDADRHADVLRPRSLSTLRRFILHSIPSRACADPELPRAFGQVPLVLLVPLSSQCVIPHPASHVRILLDIRVSAPRLLWTSTVRQPHLAKESSGIQCKLLRVRQWGAREGGREGGREELARGRGPLALHRRCPCSKGRSPDQTARPTAATRRRSHPPAYAASVAPATAVALEPQLVLRPKLALRTAP